MATIIKNVRLLGKENLWDILIEGQYIKRIAQNISVQAWESVDGQGCVAMPGLVNAHTHAAMTLLRGYADDMPLMSWLHDKIWPAESKLTNEAVYSGTMLACIEMIKSGTTCMADMYMHTDAMARAVEQSGLRASLSGALFNKETLSEQPQDIAKWHGAANGRIQMMLGPHSLYSCDEVLLREIVKMADKLDVGVHIHLAETKDEENIVLERYGVRPVAFARRVGLFDTPLLAAHMVHINDEDIAVMQPYFDNIAAVNNPNSNMKLSSGVSPVHKMLKAGVRVAIGTDGASSNNSLDMLSEMKTSSLCAKLESSEPIALSAMQTITMATENGARGTLFDKVGRLEEGYKADIILVDMKKPHLTPLHNAASHIVYAAVGSDVKTTIIDGKILMHDYKLTTLDEEKIMADGQSAARKLVE